MVRNVLSRTEASCCSAGRDTFFKLFVLCFLPRLAVLSKVTVVLVSIQPLLVLMRTLCKIFQIASLRYVYRVRSFEFEFVPEFEVSMANRNRA